MVQKKKVYMYGTEQLMMFSSRFTACQAFKIKWNNKGYRIYTYTCK